MEQVYVFIAEGTLYKGDKEQVEDEKFPYPYAILTPQEWDELDLSQQYTITNGNLTPFKAPVIVDDKPVIVPPMSLQAMYSHGGAGEVERIDALWDFVVNQDRTKVNALVDKRRDIEIEWQRLTEEYEASK